MQNTIGSVIGIADSSGNLVEKVIYTTYGTPTFVYDEEAPKVDVVRTLFGNIVFRFSEAVDKSTANEAIKIKKGAEIIPGSIEYSDNDKVATFNPSTALPQGEALTILVTVDLKDTFDNSLENEFSRDFSYASEDAVVYDRVPPDVEAIYFRAGEFFVEFSEEIHPGSIADSIDLTSSQGTLTGAVTQEDSKTLKFVPSASLTNAIEYTVNIRTSPTDLSSKSLVGVFSEAFIYAGKDEFIFEKPDPTQHKESRIGNNILFQGRNYEYETGLYYFRARYYHPELGRFLQNDPMGYHDSMNMYQAFNQNPVNFVDPMGLGKVPSLFVSGSSGSLEIQENCRLVHMMQAKIGLEVYKYTDFGDANDAIALTTGYSPLDGKKVNWTKGEKTVTGIGIALPVVGGRLLRKVYRGFAKLLSRSDEVSDLRKIQNLVDADKGLDNALGTLRVGKDVVKEKILADTNLLINALEKGNHDALKVIESSQTFITTNQFKEFLNVTDKIQKNARFQFLKSNGIVVLGGKKAKVLSQMMEFQKVFKKVRKIHGRGDAALAAFSKVTGIDIVTAERRLFNFLTKTMKNLGIRVRRVK